MGEREMEEKSLSASHDMRVPLLWWQGACVPWHATGDTILGVLPVGVTPWFMFPGLVRAGQGWSGNE